MKILGITAALLCTALLFAGDDPIVGGSATVKIQSQHIFPRPVFYATPVGELVFGNTVTILEESSDWFRVSTSSGITGWVHATSLTGAVLGSGQIGSGSGDVTSDEIMLAGRGFNSDVENSYRNINPGLHFDVVDQMEAFDVSPEEIYSFLVEGRLISGDEPQGAPAPSSGGGR